MAKLYQLDERHRSGQGYVCDHCSTVFIRFSSPTNCPKCGGKLNYKELSRVDTSYEVDERSQ